MNHFLPFPWVHIITHILSSHCPPLPKADFGRLKNNPSRAQVHAATAAAGTCLPAADWSVFRINLPTPAPRASARGTQLSQHPGSSPPFSPPCSLLWDLSGRSSSLPSRHSCCSCPFLILQISAHSQCSLPFPVPAPQANGYLFSAATNPLSAPAAPLQLGSAQEMAELQVSCYHGEKGSQQRLTRKEPSCQNRNAFIFK